MQTTKARTGCGCDGRCGCGGRCGGGCGCKPARLPEAAPALCSPCDTASFVRPRFFAGQLLTEDDLSALVDYVVSKDRFHNARLFGEGVVCGLLVECGPCDGQIVIEPGYALDCCGNDLVLTCQQRLDLAPMIRELASHKDCGCTDPCAEPCAEPTITQTATKESAQAPPPRPCKQYCLYAKYAERPDQPVAAYPVGGDCDAASCEPTRIVEGIVFELRCPTAVHHPNIHDAQKCCRDLVDTKDLLEAATSFRVVDRALAEVLDQSKIFSEASLTRLREAYDLEHLLSDLHGRDRIFALIRYVAMVHAGLTRARSLDAAGELDTKQLDANLAAAITELARADQEGKLDQDGISRFDAAFARAMVQLGPRLEDRKKSQGSAPDLLPDLLINATMMEAGRAQIEHAAVQLAAAAGCGTPKIHTDCCLQEALDQLSTSFRVSVDRAHVARFRESLGRAAGAIERFVIDCTCAAVNPPCPPCDDPGVLLACIEVDHCKVVRICNTVREYVYAPSTLRYWDAIKLPPTGFCCPHDKDDNYNLRQSGKREIRREVDTRKQLSHALSLHAERTSVASMMRPATPARDLALVHEAELHEIKARLHAAEKKLLKFEKADKTDKTDKAEKVEKASDKKGDGK